MIKELLGLMPTAVTLSGQLRAIIAARYIQELAEEGATNSTIAALLNAKGITSAHDKPFTPTNVAKLKERLRLGLNTSYRMGWEDKN